MKILIKELLDNIPKWTRLNKKQKYSASLSFLNHCRFNLKTKEEKAREAEHRNKVRWDRYYKQKELEKSLSLSAMQGNIIKNK